MPPTLASMLQGNAPCVAGTITRANTLLDDGAPSELPCDLVEVRLDLVGTTQPEWPEKCTRLEAAGYPVLVTVRLDAEGGRWSPPDEDRKPLFERALASVSAVDVEYRSPLAPAICRLAADRGKTVIVSFHDFDGTPDAAQLQAVIDGIRELPGATPKVVTMVRRDEDMAVLQELLEENREAPICILGMGDAGRASRTGFPLLGSCLTYGYIDAPSAPGQSTAAELVATLAANSETYAAAWGLRHPDQPLPG